jgi:hypothetical protein
MKIAVAYCFPMVGYPPAQQYAARFVAQYHECPPGREHSTVILCNGGAPDAFTQTLFGSLPELSLLQHDNSGYDIGAFQMASRTVPCDLMVFLGSSAWPTRPGWLERIAQATERHGFGLYGAMANTGDNLINVSPHIRTTGFWIQPSLFNKYPFIVKEARNRYEFEHGKTCLTNWITKQGLHAWMVTWYGEYLLYQWSSVPNAFQNGDQSAVVIRDRLTEPPFWA